MLGDCQIEMLIAEWEGALCRRIVIVNAEPSQGAQSRLIMAENTCGGTASRACRDRMMLPRIKISIPMVTGIHSRRLVILR